jgi:hypothetical protein
MKLSHIAKAVNTDKGPMEVLTHFIHVEDKVININTIVTVWFDIKKVVITTTDGVCHTVIDTKEIDLLKKFFQWEK